MPVSRVLPLRYSSEVRRSYRELLGWTDPERVGCALLHRAIGNEKRDERSDAGRYHTYESKVSTYS